MNWPSQRNAASPNHTTPVTSVTRSDPLAVLRTFRVPASPNVALARFKPSSGSPSLLPRHDLIVTFTIPHLQLCIVRRGDIQHIVSAAAFRPCCYLLLVILPSL
jgi:hypothetical protein